MFAQVFTTWPVSHSIHSRDVNHLLENVGCTTNPNYPASMTGAVTALSGISKMDTVESDIFHCVHRKADVLSEDPFFYCLWNIDHCKQIYSGFTYTADSSLCKPQSRRSPDFCLTANISHNFGRRA